MPIRSTVPRLALSAALLLRAAPSRGDENVPDVLRRQTQELVDAIATGSKDVWDRYLDPGVRVIDETGTVQNKRQMLDQAAPLPPGVTGSIRLLDFDAEVHGDVAVATYVDDESENFHGHALHCQYRTTDTWKRTTKGWRLIASQVLALRADPPAVSLPAALRDDYAGTYELAAGIRYEIRSAGDALEGQQTGRKPEILKAEAPDVLFVPGKPRYRYVFLRDADGKIIGFAQRREAWDLVWNREGGPAAP